MNIKRILLIGGGVVVLIAAIVGYYAIFGEKESPYLWTEAARGDIREVVSETGIVKSVDDLDLNFKTSGTIKDIKVQVGQIVSVGDELISLDSEELELRAREARSARNAASAKLRSALSGATTEDIKVYETAVLNAEENLSNVEKSNAAEIASAQKSLDKTTQDVENAKVALEDAERNLVNVETDAESDYDDAYEDARVDMEGDLVVVSTALGDMDSILGIDNTTANNDFQNNLGVYDPSTKTAAEQAYRDTQFAYDDAVAALGSISSDKDYEAIDNALPLVEDVLNEAKDALYKTWVMLDNSLTDINLTVTELDAKKSTMNTDRTSVNTNLSSLAATKQAISSTRLTNQINIDTAQSSVNTAESSFFSAEKSKETYKESLALTEAKAQTALDTAKGQLRTAEDQLAFKKASPEEADVAYYRAEVSRAEASLDLVQKQIKDATLKSPIEGVVSKVDFKVGETVQSTSVVVSLLSSDNFQIEADVSELDINKIKQDDRVEVTFDAISEIDLFPGKVLAIDPAEKVIDGDIYYRIVLVLDEENEFIKSGMTADIDIITGFKSDVLLVPSRAIVRDGKEKKIRILNEKEEVETNVITVGLEGVETTEILNGVNEGDKVITFIRDN